MSLKDDTLKSLLELEKEAILHIEEFLKNEYKAITKALGFEKMGKYIEDFENREVYKSYLQHCSTIFIRYVEEIESSQALLGGEVTPPLSSKFYWDKIEKSSKNNSNSATSDPDETNVSEPDTDEICGEETKADVINSDKICGEETKVGVMSTYEVECNWYIRPDGDTEPSGDAEPNGDVELGFSKDIKITINDVGSGYFTHVLNIIAKAFGDELDESTLSNHILNTLDLHTDSAEITKITVSADGSIKVTITCTNSAHQKEVFELNDGIGTKKTTYFKDLWKLLDLTHNSTRKLLPYLLAAYTCNEPRNQLIRRDTTGWKMIFNTEEADSNNIEDVTYDDAEKSFKRRNDQITKLSRRFSFENSTISHQKCSNTDQNEKKKQRKTHRPQFINHDRPFSDRLFVQKIFIAWAAIIFLAFSEKSEDINRLKESIGLENHSLNHLPSETKATIDQLKQEVDLKSCLLLYLYYVERDVWESLPSNLSMDNILSNEYLKTLFQTYFEPGIYFSLW